MTTYLRPILLVGFAAMSTASYAEKDAETWIGVGGGYGSGEVNYDCVTSIDGRCRESSRVVLFNVNVTAVSDLAFRARYSTSFEFTDEQPEEGAIMIGFPFQGPKGPILFVGGSRTFHADDNLPKPVNGIAVEMSFARWGGRSFGGEFGIQGNISGDDVSYAAVSLGFRFGDLNFGK